MKKTLLLIATGVVMGAATTTSTYAAILQPQQALERVNATVPCTRTSTAQRLVYTAKSLAQTPAYYVFDRGNSDGYMIVSASDATEALLGYADSGTFAADSMSPSMRWWLDCYVAQIRDAEQASGTRRIIRRSAPAQEREAIAPITVTTWDQGSPYNTDCPTVSGVRCYTGCVATATAQVMKVHNWPAQGAGSNSYTWNYTTPSGQHGSQTLSMDFSGVNFDWADMIDSYAGTSTDAQKAAVAELMHAVGVGVSMQYGTSESGAQSVHAATALLDNFGYDPGLRYEMRDYYTLADWQDLIYGNLAKGLPVLMGGRNDTGGHEFVCDGYSSDGFFHFNWGWSGLSDGYYRLTALNPESQGAGGTTSGYNDGQDIIINIQRPAGGERQPVAIGCYGTMGADLQSGLLSFSGGFINISPTTGNVTLGMEFVDAQGQSSYLASQATSTLTPNAGYNYYAAEVQGIPDGDYKVYPVYSLDGGNTWQRVKIKIGAPGYAAVTVSNNVAVSAKMSTVTPLEINGVDLVSPIYIGSTFRIDATVVNPSQTEALEDIYVAFAVDNGEGGLQLVARGYDYAVDVQGGASTDITYQSVIYEGASNMQAGEYYLVFVDPYDNIISEPQTVTVNAAAQTEVTVDSWSIVAPDLNAVDKSAITFEADVECTEGFYAGAVTAYIFPVYNSGESVQSLASIASPTQFITEGQTVKVTFTGAFPNGEAGTEYFAMLRGNSGWLSQTQVNFRLADPTVGIEDIAADNNITTEYYTLQGVRVSADRLTPVCISCAMATRQQSK